MLAVPVNGAASVRTRESAGVSPADSIRSASCSTSPSDARDAALRCHRRWFGTGVRRGGGVELLLQPEEIGVQVRRVLIPQRAILFEELQDRAVEVLRQLRIYTRGSQRRAVQNRLEYDRGGVPLEGQDAGGHLVEHDTQREEIGTGIELFSARLLR